MEITSQRLTKKKRLAAKRPAKAKITAAAARENRMARRAAQKDAACAAVAHISSENSREYRKNNPVPTEFWDQPTAE